MHEQELPVALSMEERRLGYRSLFLSLAFYFWWFVWALLGQYQAWARHFYAGLPLWFWLGCVISLPLLLELIYLYLPKTKLQEASEQGGGQNG